MGASQVSMDEAERWDGMAIAIADVHDDKYEVNY